MLLELDPSSVLDASGCVLLKQQVMNECSQKQSRCCGSHSGCVTACGGQSSCPSRSSPPTRKKAQVGPSFREGLHQPGATECTGSNGGHAGKTIENSNGNLNFGSTLVGRSYHSSNKYALQLHAATVKYKFCTKYARNLCSKEELQVAIRMQAETSTSIKCDRVYPDIMH